MLAFGILENRCNNKRHILNLHFLDFTMNSVSVCVLPQILKLQNTAFLNVLLSVLKQLRTVLYVGRNTKIAGSLLVAYYHLYSVIFFGS
jgi:hypothetical protein